MKALSIQPPWAWLIVNGFKDVENRSWYTPHRGKLLIHASKKWDQEGFFFAQRISQQPIPIKNDHVFGAIIGLVDVVDCISETNGSEWFFGPWGFVFKNPLQFKEPIPCRGQLGLFNVPDRLLKGLKEDLND